MSQRVADQHYLKGQSWAIGDRVIVMLPDKSRAYAPETACFGTVEAIDLPGVVKGVSVRLDEPINGVDNCYALHNELRRLYGEA